MKSKKIIAMIVAFAAFMAVATSGFAAVSTTTTYNQLTDKVVVDVDVTEATEGSEVTYLVKNSDDIIVYIDQKTADEYGAVGFDYKIAKDKIEDLETTVKFGTNGDKAITDTTALVLNDVIVTKDANVTAITFYKDATCAEEIGAEAVVGTEDVIYAKVEVASGYEIDQVSGLVDGSGDVYKVQGTAISVTTKATKVDPGVETPADVEIPEVENETVEVDGKPVEVKTVTKVLKVVGQPTEVGVIYNGVEYPALNVGGESKFTTENGLCAVRIIVGKDVVVDGLQAYFK